MTTPLPAEALQTATKAPEVPAASAVPAAPAAPAAPGAGVSIRAFACGIVALLTSFVAVVSWPFTILAVIFGVIGLRRRAPKRWMNVVGIVLGIVGLLGTFVLPTLVVGVAFLMFGELAPEDVLGTYWHYWIGQYLVLG